MSNGCCKQWNKSSGNNHCNCTAKSPVFCNTCHSVSHNGVILYPGSVPNKYRGSKIKSRRETRVNPQILQNHTVADGGGLLLVLAQGCRTRIWQRCSIESDGLLQPTRVQLGPWCPSDQGQKFPKREHLYMYSYRLSIQPDSVWIIINVANLWCFRSGFLIKTACL